MVESVQAMPHHRKQQLISSIPNIDSLEADGGDEYSTMKRLQRHLEYIQLQEEYIKDEQRSGSNSHIMKTNTNTSVEA